MNTLESNGEAALTMILILGLAAVWLVGSMMAVALCVAARRGDDQRVIDDEIVAARIAVDRQLAQALAGS
jgi:hypothetical protein